MSWITVVWSMNAAACLTLAAFYGVVWCKQRDNWVHLLFSFSALAAAAISIFELLMINATTVEQYELLVRWIHVPTWILIVSFVAFVRLYLHAGKGWLAWGIYGLRTLVLILNFIFPVSINFRAITDIRHFSWAGEIVSVPVGLPNPWGLLSNFSLLLLLIFFVDATITVWRRGDQRRALFVGGSMIFGAILAWHVPLVIWGVIDVPFFLGFTYTAIVAAMGYELSNDMARSARLARELEASDKRLNLAADSADLGLWEWDLSKDEIWVSPTHPLAAILINAQAILRFMARDDADLDEVREILNDIITEDQRAGEVIHRLRLLRKKGEPQEQYDDVDLDEVVRDVLKLMRNDLINQNVTVDTDLAQSLPAVIGDRVQLQQVLLNLVLNACEAMADCDSSERQLLIASKSEKGTVRVSVTDRGGGVSEGKREQLFERFFTTKKEGMGLGLSICRTIINAHRGEIWATNNGDGGATFHFSVPIVRSGALSAASPKVLDGSALTATGASAPRAAAPSVLLGAGANGS